MRIMFGIKNRILKLVSKNSYYPSQLRGYGNTSTSFPSLFGDALIKAYSNPVVYSTVNVWGNTASNMKLGIRDIKKDEIITDDTISSYGQGVKNLYKITKQPNPFMSWKEFFKTHTVIQKINGNSYNYAKLRGTQEQLFKLKLEDLEALYVVWPQYMYPLMSRNRDIFPSTKKELIAGWKFEAGVYSRDFNTHVILHRNEPSIDIFNRKNPNPYNGTSPLTSCEEAVDNINKALETRNVFLKKRGMFGFMSPDLKDATGNLPMQPKDREQFDKDMEGYGGLDDQSQIYVVNIPTKWTNTSIDPKKLGVFDEVWNSAKIVTNSFNVPDVLVKYDLTGTTFENQDKAMVKMYQDSTIPYAEDYVAGLNSMLNVDDYDVRLVASFDHIQVLQEDRKLSAETNAIEVKTGVESFKAGVIKLSFVQELLNVPESERTDKFIFDFTDREISIILQQLNALSDGSTQE